VSVSIEGAQTPRPTCVHFSKNRLAAGERFTQPLPRNLEFRLIPLSSGDHSPTQWFIEVGPRNSRTDYLWIVEPPWVQAPHLIIGASYGTSARESLYQRQFRFVVTPQEMAKATVFYDEFRAGDGPDNLDNLLDMLSKLGRGSLTFRIVESKLGSDPDVIDWIRFDGRSCVPAP